MKQIYKIALLVGFLLLWAGSLWYVYSRTGKIRSEKAYWKNPNFKPDTVFQNVYIPSYYPEYKDGVKPKIVTLYSAVAAPKTFLEYQDSLLRVIDTLQDTKVGTRTIVRTRADTVYIKPDFLTLFPKANKLITAHFGKDTMTFDFLDISGQMKQEVYPIDASLYNYQYRTNSLFAEERKTRSIPNSSKKKSLIRYDGTYLYYDRDLLGKTDRANATISLDIWKIRAQGYAETDIRQSNPKFRAGARLGYRLF